MLALAGGALASPPAAVPAYAPVPALGSDSIFGTLTGVLSRSTGSVAADALIGALAGYLVAPRADARLAFALGGGVATGAAGVLGLVGTIGYGCWSRRR